jgi:TetR/AcrR family transcriptional repressor of nem operon
VNTRRIQILDSAAELIATKGFAQTSVDELIAFAGLSGKSHFYHYFKSKEQLGHEVITRQFDLVAERGLVILRDAARPPMDRLFDFIDAIVELQCEEPKRCGSPFGTLATEMADLDEGFRLRIAQVFRIWSAQLQTVIEEAQESLSDDVSSQRLARFIISTLEGATQMARMKRDVGIVQGVGVDLKRFVASHQKPITVS